MIKTARSRRTMPGVEELIELKQVTLQSSSVLQSLLDGVIVSNPPYGERLGTEPGLDCTLHSIWCSTEGWVWRLQRFYLLAKFWWIT